MPSQIVWETGKAKMVRTMAAQPRKTELRWNTRKASTKRMEKTAQLASERTISLSDFCLTSWD